MPTISIILCKSDKVGLDNYIILQAAGLDPTSESATAQNIVVAEADSVDAATAGNVSVSDVFDVVTALLEAPRLPGGPVVLSVAGSGVDNGEIRGQLAAALSTTGERNAAEAAARAAEEEPKAAAAPPAGIFGFGTKKVPSWCDCSMSCWHYFLESLYVGFC